MQFLTLTKRPQFFWCQHLNRKIHQKHMSEITHWLIARFTSFKSTIQEIPEGLIPTWFLLRLWHNIRSMIMIVKGIWLSGKKLCSVQGLSLMQMTQKTLGGDGNGMNQFCMLFMQLYTSGKIIKLYFYKGEGSVAVVCFTHNLFY